MRPGVVLAGLVLVGCSLSPLQNRIKPGEEPFVVLAGTGTDGHVDLYATLPGGGDIHQLTFTAMVESSPRLSARGDVLAFLRHGEGSARSDGELVVMNLLNGAERRLDLPPAAGTLTGLGWSDDERTLYVRTSTGAWRVAAPPLPPEPRPVTDAERAAADSALMTLLGTPRFASAAPCDSGGVCITGADGTPRRVDPDGRAPFRWGSDSVAWLVGDRVAIRPLGPGPVRRLDPDLTRISGITGASYASP
ncbi:MAG: hypothetical protein KC544_07870 [Gemmatimonadetes bacterium]|nr:hypothetical protein [Gemmatimonadota bacterium]MCB9504700.1 hypothetical protein [Gemmatimonadales bacterium]HPF61038.1 hypothetical protein [Gemmatimonadales bacterium]HRX17882.1 hypothetical protein [Gemmatimonadales bacterium]